ncbi:uncharacterized protein LOC134237898 [Saccostrea cucullata]|uniref:uncharacterized protein LOC134237898 n=1 Tax=Saccostrea cuccullata TaxID=36930 RepID=UPI002ED18E37
MDTFMILNMKIIFLIYISLHYFSQVNSFEQLIKPGITVATSSSVGWGGFANKTVDGNYSQNNYTFCMHTAGRRREEWLKIDLGNFYNLKSVKIWYRGDKRNESENTKRLKGFSIRLSKSPEPIPIEKCYQDPGNESLPVMIARPCKGVARYVWFYTDKNNGGGVFLEICEVHVYGCPEKHYGENCSRCSRCKDTCDVITGKCSCTNPGYKPPKCKTKCQNGWYGANCKYRCRNCVNKNECDHVSGVCKKGCSRGWKDIKCDQPCNKGFYGKNCSKSCGHCANKTACHPVNGNCPSGICEPGWKHRNVQRGRKCNKECRNGNYGSNCKDKCSRHCARGLPCRKTDGICVEGCAAGWKSPNCSEACNHGFYGQECNNTCGHCAKNKTCNNVYGSCPSGECAPGHKPTPDRKCNQECENERFGNNCMETCSGHCRGGLPCNKTDGICRGGCAEGWMNPFCNETCSRGFYGMECRLRCGKCAKNAKCNHVNGSCPSSDCIPGFKQTDDQMCNKECDNGTFGNNCEKNCSGHCAGGISCNKTNGACPGGCKDGWISPKCNETCKTGYYGTNCSLSCGSCALKETCDHVTGSCPSGLCKPGWKKTRDNRCDQECDEGTFGKHCMYNCSRHCAGGVHCNVVDGACSGGCSDGWTNDQCNETCGIGLYGKDCQEKCGHCGDHETCNHINGLCLRHCEPGYQGEKCDIECDDGAFGFSCNFSCAKGCLSICNKKIGACDQCLSGYIGDFCNITVAESQAQDSTVPAAGVGVPITILVIIALTVLAVVLLRKARLKKAADLELPERKKLSINDSPENETNGNVVTSGYGGNVEENALLENYVTDNSLTNTIIKITDLEKIIKIFSSEENKRFNEEFKQIPYGEQKHIPCSVAKLQQNMPKNRYKTTFPYDHSRVVLNVSPDNDYINANYIKDVAGKRRYIATQGPRKNTVQDFWEMIWQEDIRVIVMVTNLIEGSKIKCEQYWPGQGEQMTSGQFCLQLMSQKDYANYTQRDINMTNKKTNVVKTINQVQFTAWPDHGTPSPIELLVFYRHVMRLMLMYPESLLVVHCSAGIGRTGTFIALDALYKHGQKEGKIDIVEYVKIMREDRMNMIQNEDQYVFLYKALYEIFKTKGRLLSKEHFIEEVTSQLMSNKAANASQFKKEFNELLSDRPVLEEKDTKEARENLDLNMTQTVLPADDVRVSLTSYVRGRGSYYNAVSISSYTLKGGIIAAQYPVEGAAVDLVRLLIDQECSILVSVNQLSDIASSAEWMTTSAEKSVISPYKTMLGTGRSLSNKLKMTVLKMKHDKDSEWHTVKVFEVFNWKGSEKLPAEEDVLVELMNTIQEYVKDPSTKITVLSRDGATGCGIFCAVYNAIQQLQQDNEVDMFTIVRQLQMRRPEMISTMSEYQCCCKVVANFFSAYKDHIYENAQGRQEVTKMEENIYANTSP